MNTSDIHDVAIVGAGPAGLSAAHELTKAGFTPLVLERTPAVGDVWRNHYDGLRLNTGRFCSALPGNKFPLSAGGWPSRDEVVALLENMPERGGFTVQTSIEIEKIRYDHERDIWQITSIDNQQFESRAVVIATGTNRIPVIPEWEGKNTFAGKIIHSSQFKMHRNMQTSMCWWLVAAIHPPKLPVGWRNTPVQSLCPSEHRHNFCPRVFWVFLCRAWNSVKATAEFTGG